MTSASEPMTEEAEAETTAPTWNFFTNHGHVLFVLASNPDSRTRDIAERVQITERAAQRIVRELEEGGYISIVKKGRRNSYLLNGERKLRHPIEKHCSISALIETLEL